MEAEIVDRAVKDQDDTISVVMPAYNSPHIRQSLISILEQTGHHLKEVYVVDDASTDDTASRVTEIAAADVYGRVKPVRLGMNQGPSAAKNTGIRLAEGNLVAIVDSDVVLHQDCLNELEQTLRVSGADAAMAFFEVPRGIGVLSRISGYDLEHRLEGILHGRPWVEVGKVGSAATLYRRSQLLKAGLFDKTRRAGEDTDLSFRLKEQGSRLVLSGRAKVYHYWQNRNLIGYIKQMIAYGEGALRAYMKSGLSADDPISNPSLRFNAALATLSLIPLALSVFYLPLLWVFLSAIALQVTVDLPTVAWILRRKKDAVGIVAPLVFLMRNYTWSLAVISVAVRTLFNRVGRLT